MMQLYQAEWCAYSRQVRSVLTEREIRYEIINVPVQKKMRNALFEATKQRAIPALVTDDGQIITESKEIIAYIENNFSANKQDIAEHLLASQAVFELASQFSPAIFQAQLQNKGHDIGLELAKHNEGLVIADAGSIALLRDADLRFSALLPWTISIIATDDGSIARSYNPALAASLLHNATLNRRAWAFTQKIKELLDQ